MQIDWSPLVAFVRRHDNFVVTAHIHPDGDAIGSALALKRLLDKLGKRARCVLPDVPAAMYERFYEPGEIQTFDSQETDLSGYPAVIVADVSTWDRLGDLGKALKPSKLPIACIDHHPSSEQFADVLVRDTEASATAVLVHDLVAALGVEIDRHIAEPIYMGLMVDTQSFRLPNTNADAHRVAAACLKCGVEPATIYEPIYGTCPKRKMDLLAAALPTLSFHAEGKVATIHTTQEMYSSSGASGEDDEGLVEYPRAVEGVEVAIFLRERDDGTVKVSWRSRGDYDIRESAVHFGGGGHVRAAGATIEGKVEIVREAVVDEVTGRLFHGNGAG